jgi:hypothetical protein
MTEQGKVNNRIALLLVGVACLIGLALAVSSESGLAHSTPGWHGCGRPPGWSGHLAAKHTGCHTARWVFKHVRCSNRSCSRIHAGSWACRKHAVNPVTSKGWCAEGNRRVRWTVYE